MCCLPLFGSCLSVRLLEAMNPLPVRVLICVSNGVRTLERELWSLGRRTDSLSLWACFPMSCNMSSFQKGSQTSVGLRVFFSVSQLVMRCCATEVLPGFRFSPIPCALPRSQVRFFATLNIWAGSGPRFEVLRSWMCRNPSKILASPTLQIACLLV